MGRTAIEGLPMDESATNTRVDEPLRDRLARRLGAVSSSRAVRDGTHPLERLAVARVEQHIAAMSASDVIHLAIWPARLADLATRERLAASQISATLRGRPKKYWRVRRLFADQLQVPLEAVSHLIEAPRAPRKTVAPPTPPVDLLLARLADEAAAPAHGRLGREALLPQGGRDGTNPIERQAVYRVQTEIAAFSASLVAQLALWPETMAQWAEARKFRSADLYTMLAGGQIYPRVLDALAAHWHLTPTVLRHLIAAPRATPTLVPLQPATDAWS